MVCFFDRHSLTGKAKQQPEAKQHPVENVEKQQQLIENVKKHQLTKVLNYRVDPNYDIEITEPF